MKRIFVIIVLIAGALSCHTAKKTSRNTVVENSKPSQLDGSWQLQMLFAADSSRAKVPFININVNDKTFTGNSGCNTLRGKFTISDNYLAFDKNMLSTKMACLDAKSNLDEKAFLSTLLKINKYSIDKDELELGQGEIVLMKFKRK